MTRSTNMSQDSNVWPVLQVLRVDSRSSMENNLFAKRFLRGMRGFKCFDFAAIFLNSLYINLKSKQDERNNYDSSSHGKIVQMVCDTVSNGLFFQIIFRSVWEFLQLTLSTFQPFKFLPTEFTSFQLTQQDTCPLKNVYLVFSVFHVMSSKSPDLHPAGQGCS